MKALKYILLYTPVTLVSVMGFVYYGIDFCGVGFEGLITTGTHQQIVLFKELYRMVNTGIVPISFCFLIAIIANEGKKQDMPFRVQSWFMILFFIAPKLIDHIITVRNTYLGINTGFDAYTYNGSVMLTLLIGYVASCHLRIRQLKKEKK